MKYIIKITILGLIVLSTGIFAQNPEGKNKVNPCDSVVFQKAQKYGLRSLSIKEIPVYYWNRYRCKRSGHSTKHYAYIENTQLETDSKNANNPKGWTSTFIYLVTIGIVTYSIQQSVTNL